MDILKGALFPLLIAGSMASLSHTPAFSVDLLAAIVIVLLSLVFIVSLVRLFKKILGKKMTGVAEHPPDTLRGCLLYTSPVDLTFFLDARTISVIIPELIIKSGEVDGIVLHGAMGTGFMDQIFTHAKEMFGLPRDQFLEAFREDTGAAVELPKKYGFPLLVSSFFGESDDYAAAYQDHDIPVYDSPEKTARAMAALWKYRKIRERALDAPPPLPPAEAEAEALIAKALKRGARILDEFSSKKVLAAYGIPTGAEKLVLSAEEAAGEARRLGYPVVLKGCSEEIAHKTGKGLIHLNLKDESAVCRSFEAIREAAGKEIPVLVARMIRGDRELVAGAIRQPGFGPCVMFGLGGIFTEALQDTVFRLAPLSQAEAQEMLAAIRARTVSYTHLLVSPGYDVVFKEPVCRSLLSIRQ